MTSFRTKLRKWFSGSGTTSQIELLGIPKIDTMLQDLVDLEQVPGISAHILKEGTPLLNKGYGYADIGTKVHVQPGKTLFRVASISKCITGLALAKMVENDILQLDDSFYKYVPDYPKKDFDFTLRQLATHTAGIRGYRGKEYALNQPYSIKDSIQVFQDDPLQFEPGKGYLYNSFDYVLLSLAMQEASGVPFDDYVQQYVLAPLGMHCTFSPVQLESQWNKISAEGLGKASFYSRNKTGFKKAVVVNNQYKLAGGGYLSTAEDIGRLGQAVLQATKENSELAKEVLRAQTVLGRSTFYGLGFQVSEDSNGRGFVGHVGNSVGAYSNFFVYPKEKMVVVLLINCTDPKVQHKLDKIINCALSEN
nr:serine hydrolase domain-containing protein [Allomuricauda sp.]